MRNLIFQNILNTIIRFKYLKNKKIKNKVFNKNLTLYNL